MKKILFIVLLTLTGAAHAAEPTIKLRMDVSPREITIGDPIQCNITVIYSDALKPAPLLLPATGEFELLAARPPQMKTLPSNETEMTYPFLLTTFSTGTVTLPAFVLNFTTEDGQRAEARTQPLDITVASVLEKAGDEGKLRPLKGPYNYRSYFWLWVTLSVLALLVLAYFALRTIKRRRHGVERPAGPPKPAEETAWDALQKLEELGLIEKGHTKEFYIQLSVILRTYLEDRFDISSLDRTTSELLSEVRRLDLTTDTTLILRVFIENSDLVKFAKFTPTGDEIESDLNRVKQLITVTTPQQKIAEPEKIPV